MQELISQVEEFDAEVDHTTSLAMIPGTIFITTIIVHVILHWVVLHAFEKRASASSHLWLWIVTQNKLFHWLAFTLQGIIVNIQAVLWLRKGSEATEILVNCAQLWIMIYALLSLFSLLGVTPNLSQKLPTASQLSLKGIFQGIKLIDAILVGISMTSLLTGQSPTILINNLGAMAAALMLVLKDPIFGLVAGIQLSANDILKPGDWLKTLEYGIDSVVVNIGLAAMKVRSWDNTITAISIWSLILDSFKNWNGMSASDGRKIKHSISIDATSIHSFDGNERQYLHKAHLLKPYLITRHQKIDE